MFEFENFEKLSEHYKDIEIIQITKRIGLLNIRQPFEYDGKANSEIRKIAKNRLLTSYPNLNSMKAGIHIAWNKARWRELFSLEVRRKKKFYTKCAFTLGNPFREGEQLKMPFVEWKPEFRDVSICDDPNVVYAFQTTKNTWKAFKVLSD